VTWESDEDSTPEQVRVPLSAELDLHTFLPSDVPSLIAEYFHACRERSLLRVRIVHGKGKGVQRARVRQLLATRDDVLSYRDAPPASGFWGATVVCLAPLLRAEGGGIRDGEDEPSAEPER
jgi:DNA-nicking Smr family endonuclease